MRMRMRTDAYVLLKLGTPLLGIFCTAAVSFPNGNESGLLCGCGRFNPIKSRLYLQLSPG